MTYNSDRPLLYPTEITELTHLIWHMLDVYDEHDGDITTCFASASARDALCNFIVEHKVAVLDLIQRGRGSTWMRTYEATKYRPNGSPLPEFSKPYALYEGREETLREVLGAPFTKYGVQSSPPLSKLIEEADTASVSRGHILKWHLTTDESAYGQCLLCGKGVGVLLKPTPNQINIGGEAVALNCVPNNQKSIWFEGKAVHAAKEGSDDQTLCGLVMWGKPHSSFIEPVTCKSCLRSLKK